MAHTATPHDPNGLAPVRSIENMVSATQAVEAVAPRGFRGKLVLNFNGDGLVVVSVEQTFSPRVPRA